MKKSFTLLTSALLLGASLSASAEVNNTEWKEGNYFYLKAESFYLTLDKTVKDSVIVTSNPGDTKFEKDMALWQITSKDTPAGPVYQFKNKATKALLAFSKKEKPSTKLDPIGVVDWMFKDDGKISGYYESGKSYNLSIHEGNLIITNESSASFEVEAPKFHNLSVTELGDGLSTFYLDIEGEYEENIFKGKELVATEVEEDAYFKLQYKDDSEFENGTPKYLGVDTIRIENNVDQKSFGLKFKADSIYKKDETHSFSNEEAQKFKFQIDLKNDSIALFVKGSPLDADVKLQIVYGSLDGKKVLTVSDENNRQGTAPLIRTLRGIPVSLPEGNGVYFLKNAGNGKNGGEYLFNNEGKLAYKKDIPSIYKPDGQWLVKENNGVYTIVDRLKGSVYAENKEIFAVKGIKNAFTIAGMGDTLSFDIQKVDLKNKFLGTLHFSNAELKEKTVKLSLGSFGYFVPITVADSLLVPEREGDAAEFRFVAKETKAVAGAKALKDTLFATSYVLTDWSGSKFLVEDAEEKSFIMTSTQPKGKLNFVFEWGESDGVYKLKAENGEYASYNNGLKLDEKPANFQVEIVDAPSYVEVDKEFIRLESNGKYLTMNPYTLFAEMKNEGQPITKAGYLASHFAMKIEKADTIIPGEPVYLISTCKIGEKDGVLSDRYYLAPIKDKEYNGETRLGFIPATEELKTSKDSPAFFAFRMTEDGSVLLENIKNSKFATQRENTMVLGEKTGMNFSIIETSDPTPNEVIEPVKPVSVVAVGGHGSVTVMNAKDKKIVITDILGKIVGNYRVTNDRFTVPVSRGLVIVAIEGEVAQKVIVK